MLQFVEYALFVSINSKDLRDDNLSRFILAYRDLVPEKHYESHFTNMHAVFLFFLSDVMLNVAQCVEFMLESVIGFNLVGILVHFITMLVIYVSLNHIQLFVKPLLKQTSYCLLLACDT